MRINYGIESLQLLETSKRIALDTETTGLQPVEGGLRLLQLGVDGEFPVVIDCWELDERGWDRLAEFFETPRQWYAHNASFDLGWLQQHHLYPAGEVYCTMLASRVLTNGLPNIKNSLQAIAQRYLGREVSKEEQKSDWSAPVLRREQLEYAANDVQLLLDLWEPITARLEAGDLMKAWALECRALPAVAQIWRTGLPFCRDSLVRLRDDLTSQQESLAAEFIVALDEALPEGSKLPRDPDGSINLRPKATGSVRAGTKRSAGFNVNSPHQLKAVFTALLGEVPVDADGKPSASRAALREYAADHAVVADYLRWKRVEKRRQMVESLLKHQDPDGFIRASYLQMGAETGRMSCISPNNQQIPRDSSFRDCVIAPEGWMLVDADFAQMELRLAAKEAGDELMARAFKESEDLHTLTARGVYGADVYDNAAPEEKKEMRQIAKSCFSADTEVLTPDGWVRLKDYKVGTLVMQYELPEGVKFNDRRKAGPRRTAINSSAWDGNWGGLEFVDPIHYDSLYSEDVWQYEDRNVSVVATGDHDIIWIDAYGAAKKAPLKEVTTTRYMVNGGYLSSSPLLTADLERVLAMFVADGSWINSNCVRLTFTKRRKHFRCGELLSAAGVEYTKSCHTMNGLPAVTYKVRLCDVPWLDAFVTPTKDLCWSCLHTLDGRVYLEEAQYWDGCTDVGASRARIHVTTTRVQSAEVMQALAATRGLSCTLGFEEKKCEAHANVYKVSVGVGTPPIARVDWEAKPAPAQQVYCVQVPSGNLLIRHNRKVSVQGNCNFGLLYGSGAKGLRSYAGAMGIQMSLEDATDIRGKFHNLYAGIHKWHQQAAHQQQNSGGNAAVRIRVSNLRRLLPGENNKLTTRLNTVIQGAGAAVLKLSLAKLWPLVHAAGENEVKIAGAIHDELLCLVREDKAEHWAKTLQQVMEEAEARWLGDIPASAEAHWGKSWTEAKG